MPLPNFHSCRIRNPDDFQPGSFRNITQGDVQIVIGKLIGERNTTTQAIRYPIDKYTEDRARASCREKDGTFEPAGEAERVEIFVRGTTEFQGGTKFKKELIKIGNWTHPQHPDQRMNITKELLQSLIDNFERYKANGGKIPIPLRHTDAPEKNTGWVEQLTIEDDRLFGILDITDEDIAKKLEDGTIQDVSISFGTDFTDEKGNKYDNFLFHIALTTIPHIRGQGAFIKLEAEYKELTNKPSDDLEEPKNKKKEEVKMIVLETALQKVKDGKTAELTAEESQALLTEEQKKTTQLAADLKAEKESKATDPDELATLEAESKTNKDKITKLEKDLNARKEGEVKTRVEKLCEAGIITPANKEAIIKLAMSKEAQSSVIELEVEKADKTKEKITLNLATAMFEILEKTPAYIGFKEKTETEQKKPGAKGDELTAGQKTEVSKAVADQRGTSATLEAVKKK